MYLEFQSEPEGKLNLRWYSDWAPKVLEVDEASNKLPTIIFVDLHKLHIIGMNMDMALSPFTGTRLNQ